MILKEVYAVLQQHHFVVSQYDFSRRWLGKSRSYLSSSKARQRTPSLDALETLGTRLNSFVALYAKYALPSEKPTCDQLSQLRERVWEEAFARQSALDVQN